MTDSPASIPLAIVGMACRLPGAENLDAYWRLVSEGRSAIAEMPADRLDQQLYYDPKVGTRGKTYSKLAATLANREFDRAACPISDELVRSVDIAHLLMCEVSAAALRHAGLDPFKLPERNVGVYIGHAQGSTLASDYTYATCVEEAAHFLNEVEEYRQLGPQAQQEILDEFVKTIRAKLPRRTRDCADVDASLVAGTVSKAFGLTGPYLAINSACASSLQSILLAARALQLGRVEMAIAGGASDCKGDSLVLFAHAQAMSATGSRPFDSEADGLICGEGYAAIVLKTLDKALADGDRVLAVIRGLGVASDGRGKSLWAPRKEGQIEAMRRAYKHGVDMSRLQYVEAHATATQLGDATELNTLAEALTGVLPKGTKIPVTSVKANIGHTLETAGIAGVIKAVLCMQNGMFCPAIGIRELNPKIDWNNVPYYVPRQPTPWPAPADGHPRRAAVNAFGIGGLNMHVVIDQYTEAARSFFQPAPAVKLAGDDGEAIAIIGRGCILPGAKDVPGYWQMLASGIDPKCDVPDGRWRTDLFYAPGQPQPFRSPTKLGGFVQGFAYDWKRHKVPPKQIAEADPLQFMLLDAADQAMREAGYDQKPFNRQLAGVVVGTEFGGDFAFQLQMGLRIPHMEHVLRGIFQRRGQAAQGAAIIPKFSATLLKKWPALIDETGSFSTSSLASRISKTWDMMGGAAAIDAGGSSALAGLAISIDMLLAGDVDLMVCAAGQRRLGLPQYEAQAINGTLATGGQPRSRFDAKAQGHVPGEGVGVLLLKRLADARRDGDKIIGIIRGVGAGHSASMTESLQLALDRSLEIAAADAADIAVLEADGIATPEARDAELAAISSAYGRQPRRKPVLVNSVISRIGHLDGAAGMASLVKATLEVEHGQIPAEAGLSQPAPQIAGAPQVLTAPAKPARIELTSRDGRRMAAVSTASRGLSFHAILEYGAKVPVMPPDAPAKAPAAVQKPAQSATAGLSSSADALKVAGAPRILRFAGPSPAAVKAAVDAALQDPAAAFASAAKTSFQPRDNCRLAIVADSPASLAEKLKLAQSQLGNPAARNVLDQQGIFFRDVYATRPRIAFAFAGQGSQYTGMLKELIAQEPAAAAATSEIDRVMKASGYPAFAQLAWDEGAGLGSDPWNTQVSLLLANRVFEQTLAARGIRPEVVFGHSYGEYAALTAAGSWDLATGLAITRARVAGIEACKAARGGMLATAATPDIIQQVAMEHRLPVYVANHNAPDQTVVGGRVEHLQDLAKHLSGRSIRSQMLPVPCPFHTPLMKDAVGPMQAALKSAALAAPQIPLVSVVTNEYVTSADAVRANLVAHNTTPVRYVDLIRRITDERPTVLVEVGPSQTLTRLHQRILPGKGEAVASDNPKRPGIEQLLNVQALLECTGALPLPESKPAAISAKPSVKPAKTMHEIIEFDATARRREKMRSGGKAMPPAKPAVSSPLPVGDAGRRPSEGASVSPPLPLGEGGRRPGEGVPVPPPLPVGDAGRRPSEGASVSPPLPLGEGGRRPGEGAPAPRIAPPTPPAQPAPAPTPAASNGEAHQNGAPKKLGTSLNPQELEKFLINFVVEQTGYPPEVVELDADLEADLGIDSIKKAQLFGELQEFFDVTPTENLTLDDFPTLRHVLNFLSGAGTPKTEPATSPAAASPTRSVSEGSPAQTPTTHESLTEEHEASPKKMTGASAEELEKFLINFVVEQTGYPPEVVELDADLEADLGIDSIKKAQLFGELQEFFDITPTDNLTLDDFPTLRHVLNFLSGTGTPKTEPAASPAAAAPTRSVSEGNPVQTLPPPGITEERAAAPKKMTGASAEELEKFLINFVVEQTGYPPEVVELDADLEADLGIDSIKKAQLFGELQEFFDITPTDNLTLDDFPTLRHVLNFLSGSAAPAEPAAVTASTPSNPGPAPRSEVAQGPFSEPEASGVSPPREIGLAAGRAHAQVICQALCRLADAGGLDPSVQPVELSPAETQELQGLADGAGLPVESLLALVTALGHRAGSATGALCALLTGAAPKQQTAPAPDEVRPQPLPPAPAVPAAMAPAAAELHAPGGIPLEADALATHRYVMRMLDRDLPAGTPAAPQWTGAALVVGRNPSADALRRKLASSGATVVDLEVTGDLDQPLSAFEALWQRQPIHHVFWMTHRDASPADFRDPAVWQVRRHANVELPFFVCQRWLQLAGDAKALGRLSLVVGVSMGGDFGFSGELAAPDGGGLTGLLKAIYLEFAIVRKIPEMILKAIDAPADEPAVALAENILREAASGTIDYEVAFVGGQRRLQTAVAAPAELASATIRRGGTWVVTGGARGITAECIRPLAERFGLVLHLIGTSPLPSVDPAWRGLDEDGLKKLKGQIMLQAQRGGQNAPAAWEKTNKAIEIDRALRAFESAGVKYHYHVCDVCDRAALAATLDKIRATSGPVDGILHGAGIDRACRFEKKQRGDVAATLGSKVDGAYHLMTLTWDDPVRHFIGFGSVSGRLGSNGQADYGQASDLLVKLITWYSKQRPDCHAIGFHWHPWDEVGMAYRPETRAMLKMNNAPDWMPKREGIEHFLREIFAERREHEVLVTDRDYYSRFYKTGPRSEDVVHDKVAGTLRVPSAGGEHEAASGAPANASTRMEGVMDGTRSVPATSEDIAQRQILRLVPAPLPAGSPATWQPAGPVLIVGDNDASRALAARLRGQGLRVDEFVVGDDIQANLAAVEQHYASELPQTVVLMTARDAAAIEFRGREAWRKRRARGVDTPFWLVQRWMKRLAKAKDRRQVTLVAATALGGDFGIGGNVEAPEGGALAGLCKSLYLEDSRRETSQIRVKVIDAALSEPAESVALAICRELAASEPEIEVAYCGGNRSVVRQAIAPHVSPGSDLPRGSVWVVTGGARGITAASVLHLGQRYGLKFHLIGKSPAPKPDSPWRHASEAELKTIKAGIVREAIAAGRSPEDDWRRVKKDLEIQESLDRFAAHGVQATYHSCDTADWEGMERTLAEIRRTGGPITGIIHAAGYGKPGRFEMRDPVNYEKAVAGKVDGMVALMELTASDPIRYFVAYGSISGRFGGNGFSDYAAANDLLAKLVAHYRQARPEARAACLEWQTWDEVGMVNLGDSAEINKNSFKMAYIPPREGVMHLDRELRAGLPTAEVVITDGFFQRTFYPHETIVADPAASATNSPSPPSTKPGSGAAPVDAATRLPLIRGNAETSAPGPGLVPAKDGVRLGIRFHPETDPFLIHHRMKDRPFLPGVVGMEAIMEAALASGLLAPRLPHSGLVLRDATILNGLMFRTSDPIDAHVTVVPQENGTLACELTNEHRDRKGRLLNPARMLAQGTVELAGPPEIGSQSGTATFSEPPLGWIDYRYVDEGMLVHGPPLRCLKHYASDHEGGWGRIVAPALAELAGPRGGAGWLLPVTVLDACVVACGTWVWWQFGGRLEVPYGFERLSVLAHPGEGELCTLRFAFRGHAGRHSKFDFTLFGDGGRPLVVAEGYQTVLIAEKFATEQLPTEVPTP